MNILKDFAQGALHLFYPRLCLACHTPLMLQEQAVCLGCSAQLPLTNFHRHRDNEAAMRLAGRVPFLFATALAWFTAEGLLQLLLHQLKYKGSKESGIYLGNMLGDALSEVPWADGIEAIIPVPLHPKKEAKRGYNQSAIIAEGISAVTNKPVLNRALIRTKNTESQARLKGREDRVRNVADAFKPGKENISGKHVLLIDDMLTTGATLEAAAQALVQEANAKVSIATIGIAPY